MECNTLWFFEGIGNIVKHRGDNRVFSIVKIHLLTTFFSFQQKSLKVYRYTFVVAYLLKSSKYT